VIATMLRYRAAQVRAEAAAATIGDGPFHHRALRPALHEVGVSPDLLPTSPAGR
jgi:hypothetical protein